MLWLQNPFILRYEFCRSLKLPCKKMRSKLTDEYLKIHNGFQHTRSSMKMRSDGHATKDPIASRNNVVSETVSGTGSNASKSKAISTDTFMCPFGRSLW